MDGSCVAPSPQVSLTFSPQVTVSVTYDVEPLVLYNRQNGAPLYDAAACNCGVALHEGTTQGPLGPSWLEALGDACFAQQQTNPSNFSYDHIWEYTICISLGCSFDFNGTNISNYERY